jgi:hypothetical protein
MSAEYTVKDALLAWRTKHASVLAKQAGPFALHLGSLTIKLPNPGKLDLHDLHHVVLGASPSIVGEIQVGAFEVMTHVPSMYIGFYDYGAVALGLLICPRRTWRWLQSYRSCKTFYREGESYEQWLTRPFEELKQFLGVTCT